MATTTARRRGGRLTIDLSKFFGLGSKRVLTCDLDSPSGKTALAQLTKGAAEGSAAATPLGAFVELVKDCPSVDDVKKRCATLPVGD